jgi:hypothetical protein
VAFSPYAPNATWENYTVTEIVKQFVKGTPNYGFIVIPDLSEGNTGRDYLSSEFKDSDSLKPKLAITYESNAIVIDKATHLKGVLIQQSDTQIKILLPFNRKCQAALFNSRGLRIKTATVEQRGSITFPTTRLSAGIYFLKFRSGITKATYKFIITQ